MADTNTVRLFMIEPEVGASDNSWGTKLNADLVILDQVYQDLAGRINTGGTANAHTITPNYTGYVLGDGTRFCAKSSQSNTAALVINFNGGGNVNAKKQVDGALVALAAGEYPSGHIGDFVYRSTLDSGSAVWVLLNPNLSNATDTVKGVVELATNAEALTGTDTSRALTADDLDYVDINRRPRTANQMAPHSNLVISRATNAAVSVVADSVVLRRAGGGMKRFAGPFTRAADISVSGAGGRDTGGEANSTWYSIYLIGKEDGTVAALLSVSRGGAGPAGGSPASSPTLPSGYTYWGWVGSVYNNGSGDFNPLYQVGNSVGIVPTDVDLGGVTISTSYHTYAITVAVPPEALSITGYCKVAGEEVNFYIAQSGSGTTGSISEIFLAGSIVATSEPALAFFAAQASLVLSTAQSIAIRLGTTLAVTSANFYVTSYTI